MDFPDQHFLDRLNGQVMAMAMEWTMKAGVVRNPDGLGTNSHAERLRNQKQRNQDGSKVVILCLQVPCSTRCGSTHSAFPPMDPNW